MINSLRFFQLRRLIHSALLALLTTALFTPIELIAQPPATHHHYKLIVIGTFSGLSIYRTHITSNHSVVTEFQQVLNNQGTLVGGADTPLVHTADNSCFNVQQPFDCYIQHAFVWRSGQKTDLGTIPGGLGSFAFFISDNGLIAGASENGAMDPFNNTPEIHAVLWSNGRLNDLGTLGGTQSLGAGVNDAGQVTGWAQNATPDPFSIAGLATQTRAFLWQNGVMQDLNTLGGPDAFAQYVNNKGQVAGVSYTSFTPDPNTGLPPLHPFLWQHGAMKDLGNFGGTNPFGPFIFGLNNRGEVTGFMTLPDDQTTHAFLWDGERLIDLNAGGGLGGNSSQPNALNDAGEVVGFATLPGDQTNHAFRWKNGVMTDLGTLHGDPCSTAGSINSSGQVVGASQSAAGGCNFYTGAFLWENGGPMVDLNTLLSSPSTLLLTGAFWINDQGEITGKGAPSGCGDDDLCGRAFLLIPCDANHPNIEGCDYSLVDAATAAALSQQPIAATPTEASEGKLLPLNATAHLRSLMLKRNRLFRAHAAAMTPGPQ